MNRPWVTIHNLASLDGRLGGFPADMGCTTSSQAGGRTRRS
jgi:riboflavin biosynthesis pyrimidine reductase